MLEKKVEFIERTAASNSDKKFELEASLSFLKLKTKVITITPLMKEILGFLDIPHSVDEIVNWISSQKHCSYNDMYSSVYKFLDRMVKIGVVVREQEQKVERDTFFSDWSTNNKFKDYTLLDQIGKKSDVFLFKCCETKKPEIFYTIKIMVGGKSKTGFFREAVLLKSLPPHPSIRKCFYSSDADDEFPHLLLEYVAGKPISNSEVKDKLPLPLKCVAAHKILLALQHMHNHGVLHGDIHASNFLIDEAGDVKLIDLGMSHHLGDDQVGHGGIAKYMAPERMPDSRLKFSNKQGNYQSEIFQVGICIYLLLSGRHPFGGMLLRDLAREIKYSDPDPLMVTPLGETIPKPIAEVVFKSLEKEPEFRYQSVAEMISAWEKATGVLEKQLFASLQ